MIDCTKFVETLRGKPVAVFGLGLSGLASLRALAAAGARVLAFDDNPDNCKRAEELGAQICALDEEVLRGCGALVLAPGVPLFFPKPHKVVVAARAAGVEVIGDLEILHRTGHGRRTVGITGTNGKSTTTALIAHILNAAGWPHVMGGNIGRAVLDLDLPPAGGTLVLEISSYQMDLCPTFRPDIAVLLNITPDHIDRHGSFEGYIKAKARMFEGEGMAILGMDDVPCQEIAKQVKDRAERTLTGFSVDDKSLKFLMDGAILKGVHNYQNMQAAYYVCKALGLPEAQIVDGIRSFAGLAHRQCLVRVINGVSYINDSKATNADSTVTALRAYEDIYWIAGGRAKEGGLRGLEPLMPRVRHAFLIGEAQDEFARWCMQNGVAYTLCETLQNAVLAAHDRAQTGQGGVVLLSPACASFDQFKSFEERGDVFVKLVEALG